MKRTCQTMSTSIFFGKGRCRVHLVGTWKNQNHATIGRSFTILLLECCLLSTKKTSIQNVTAKGTLLSWANIRNGSILQDIHDGISLFFLRKLSTLSSWNSHRPCQPSCRCWSAQANITSAGATPKLTKSPLHKLSVGDFSQLYKQVILHQPPKISVISPNYLRVAYVS